MIINGALTLTRDKGIYGEVTLIYREDTFKPHLFTYPDYRDRDCVDLLVNARAMLKKMLDKR